MEKKRKIRFIVVWLLITAAFLAGSLLVPGHGKSESVQEAMRDAVLHGTNRISLFGLKDVNPAYISSLVVVERSCWQRCCCGSLSSPGSRWCPASSRWRWRRR